MGMLLDSTAGAFAFRALSDEFARIENPEGTFPPVEIVPLAPKFKRLPGAPAAILLDMDGTITQTEPLFLYGVEQVVRQVTGWATAADWPGLDPERDYPKIVGFSTLRNLDYLYDRCAKAIRPALFFQEALDGLTFLHTHDAPQETVRWLDGLTATYGLEAWREHADDPDPHRRDALVHEAVARFPEIDRIQFANLGLIIFHADYIQALEQINRGEGAAVSQAVYGDPTIPAIAPMPGVALLCALAKGWIPKAEAPAIAAHIAKSDHAVPQVEMAATLHHLCEHFADHPVPVALVTSSGTHEASLVLQGVFRTMAEEVRGWHASAAVKTVIAEGFSSHCAYFDAMVTCDDVAGGRTKPFRDPYSLALAKLGLGVQEARRVIGFEDTEAGIIAQRGAGIGLACAVPIEHTRHHDFSAAAHVLHGGVPEALFRHQLFFDTATS